MPRRAGVVMKPNPDLEKEVGREHKGYLREQAKMNGRRGGRNSGWYILFHAHGYSARKIAEITNRNAGLRPGDPGYVVDDTVEKALRTLAADGPYDLAQPVP